MASLFRRGTGLLYSTGRTMYGETTCPQFRWKVGISWFLQQDQHRQSYEFNVFLELEFGLLLLFWLVFHVCSTVSSAGQYLIVQSWKASPHVFGMKGIKG